MFPTMAWAENSYDGGSCPHHTEHTEDCVGLDPSEGAACGFVCDICGEAEEEKAEEKEETEDTETNEEDAPEAVAVDDDLAVYALDGSGTKEDPYQVSSREDLEKLAVDVNGGNELKGLYFKQTKDIDLGGKDNPWPVIGHVIGNTPHPFSGVYDGDDHVITGLYVAAGEDEDGDPVGVSFEDSGLFGHVGEKGVVRRVHVVDCQIYSKALYVAGIAGRNDGVVEYCSSDATDPDRSTGIIKGSWQYGGGVVGYNFGTIR